MPQPFLLLSEPDVRRVLTLPALLPVMAEALARFSAGEGVQQPQRSVLAMGPEASFFGVMPAALQAPAAVGVKLVTVVHRNAERGLPSHLATLLLLDPVTGALLALMDGRYITELRTAAVSALSVPPLARAPVRRLALLGSGVQARSHLEALAHLCPLEEVRVWSPRAERRERFVTELQPGLAAALRAEESAEAAVRGADVVVLATASTQPVLREAWVAPGTHVISVGACRPAERELDPALLARARLVVDSRAAALAESGDVVQGVREGRFGPEHAHTELGDVLRGRAPGRRSDAEITVFKSLGLAVEDVCAAELTYRLALAAGLGQALEL